jgi:transketolase
MAGGLALQGFLPIVNSFAAFLASRANEQIYTNTCEGTRIIYVCHYAGLIPAGPGKSHQSVRDISLFGALPNFEILQPANGAETRMVLDYCINQTNKNCMLRLIIGPSPRLIALPSNYALSPGKGAVLKDGRRAVLFSYGPVMLHEALLAGELLENQNFSVKVVNMPWLNQVDPLWLADMVRDCSEIFVLEDHSPVGGLADHLLTILVKNGLLRDKYFKCFGVEGLPACGTPQEALTYHRLKGESIAERIYKRVRERP